MGEEEKTIPGPFPLTPTLPWIRESRFGHTLGNRAKYMERMAGANGGNIGPLDLVHWGRHYGEKSSKYLHNNFAANTDILRSKEEDGYVGYFHYVNGLDYSKGAREAIQGYLVTAIGLVATESGYFWRPEVDVALLGTYHDKQMVVTLCTYNVFARCEVHARCVVLLHKSRKRSVTFDMLYTIYSHVLRKMHAYPSADACQIPQNLWDELAALLLMRMCVVTDDVAHVLCGTVNLAPQVASSLLLTAAIGRLIAVLPRAHLAGLHLRFGAVSTCGADFVKTLKYRNHVVDAVVRLVSLDSTGTVSEWAISRLRQLYKHEYDYVVCRLLKTDGSKNQDQRFLLVVHENLVLQPKGLCMNALLMLEQARFLVVRHSYELAMESAARAVELLPLDFDAWHTLALCYVLSGQYVRALETINAFPVSFSKHDFSRHPYDVDGIHDSFAATYIERMQQGQTLDLRTFESFFPVPKVSGMGGAELASMASLWHDQFHSLPHLRHPVCGPFFRSPLAYASNIELLAVDPHLLKLAGPTALKLAFAAQSAGDPWLLIVDFDHKSTWGRTYDLVTLMVTMVGWDEVVHMKNKTFRRQEEEEKTGTEFVVDRANLSAPNITQWLQLLFLLVYEDIRAMVQISGQDHDRSALSWGAIGFVGWACKFNLKDTLSAIYTSVSATSSCDTGFDYYGTVKMLEIYNEFVLSDVSASTIDPLLSSYDGRHYTNKLIVQNSSLELYLEFTRQLQQGHFSLENVLLCLTKLVCWNVRWYNYMPCSLVSETLIKLCTKYDPLVVRSTLQILMNTHVKKKVKPAATFTLRGMFAAPLPENNIPHEFVEGDTIMIYMAQLLEWIELLADQK